MAETLYASFPTPSLAEQAVGALLDHGVRAEDISLVSSHARGLTETVAYAEEPDGDSDDDPVTAAKRSISTTTAGDAVSGAAQGAGIGLGVGAAAAIASLFVPGVGLITGAGALAAALSATAASAAAGAVTGGVVGYLKDQGVPDEAAARYHENLERGGSMISIQLPSGSVDRSAVELVLAKYQATDVGAYGVVSPSATGLP